MAVSLRLFTSRAEELAPRLKPLLSELPAELAAAAAATADLAAVHHPAAAAAAAAAAAHQRAAEAQVQHSVHTVLPAALCLNVCVSGLLRVVGGSKGDEGIATADLLYSAGAAKGSTGRAAGRPRSCGSRSQMCRRRSTGAAQAAISSMCRGCMHPC